MGFFLGFIMATGNGIGWNGMEWRNGSAAFGAFLSFFLSSSLYHLLPSLSRLISFLSPFHLFFSLTPIQLTCLTCTVRLSSPLSLLAHINALLLSPPPFVEDHIVHSISLHACRVLACLLALLANNTIQYNARR